MQTAATFIRIPASSRSMSTCACMNALREAALTAHRAQVEQNGWQYVDCLDCGELDAQARRLLARAGAVAGTEPASGTPGQEGTADLLDAAQRELLRQKQDFAARLFLHSQSLRIRYQNALEDMRLRHESELAALKEAARRRSRRRKELLRRLLEKARLS